MIFKTFDSDIDKISAKWGVFGKSFYDFAEASRNRKIAIDDLFTLGGVPLKDAKKQAGSFWSYLYPKKEDIQKQLIDVDSIIPKIDSDNFDFDNWINELNEVDKKVKAGTISWQDYSNSLDNNQKWIAKWGEETQGTIRTQEGLIKANEGARQSALAHNAALKQQTLGAKAATVAMKALSVAGNMLLIYGISKLVEGIDYLIHAEQNAIDETSELVNKAKELTDEYKEQSKKLDDYASEYKELKEKVDDANLTFDETLQIKNDLYELQENIIGTFGKEAEGIDLVNGGYQEQLEILKEINREKAAELAKQNREGAKNAKIELDKEREYSLELLYTGVNDDVLNYIKSNLNYNVVKLSSIDKNVDTGAAIEIGEAIEFEATAESAYNMLSELYDKIQAWGATEQVDVSSVLDKISTEMNDIGIDTFEGFRKTYEDWELLNVLGDFTLSPLYYQMSDAVSKYNEALISGEGVEEAKKIFDEKRLEIEKTLKSYSVDGAENVFNGLNDSVNTLNETLYQVSQDHFAKVAASFFKENKLSGDYLKNINLTDSFEAFGEERLKMLMKSYGIETENAQALIDKLVQLGYTYENTSEEKEKFVFADHKDSIESYQKILSAVSDTIEKIRDKSVGAEGIDINELMGMDEFANVDESIWNDMLARGEVSEDDMKQIAIDAWNKIHDSLKNYDGSETIIRELKDDFEKASFGIRLDIVVNENAYNELVGILDNVRNGMTFTYDEITDYVNTYGDEIAGALTAVGDAYTIEEEAIISLINKYGELTNSAIASEVATLRAAKERIEALGGIAKAQEIVKDIYMHSPTQQARDYAEQLKLDIIDAEAYDKYYDSWKEIVDTKEGLGSSTSSTENTFDWVEIKINSITEAIEKLKAIAEDPFASWNKRGSELQNAVSKTKELLDVYEKAKKVYEARANEIGLDPKYVAAIKEGAFRIDDVPEDISADTYEKIQEYQELWDKIKGIDSSIIDTNRSLNEYTQNNFDLIISEFDTKISHFENTASMIEAKLANAESRGLIATQQYYQTLHDIESGKQALLQQQLDDLTKALDGTNFETNSEGWSNLTSEIESTEIAIQESTNAMQEFNNEIRQIDWDLFDFARDQESKLMNEADFMIDLLDSAKMFSEAGEITAEGMATMGLHAQNYNAYLEQSIDYAKELASLQEIYGEDTIDANVIERRNELLELQQESILSAEAEKDAMIDLVSEGIELQKEAFQGLIDEYTEALDVQKD